MTPAPRPNADGRPMAVLCDFDGTITDIDTNDLFYHTLGGAVNLAIEARIVSGEISIMEGARQQLANIRATQDEVWGLISSRAKVRLGFAEFLRRCKSEGVPFAIVSGGYRCNIRRMLEREGVYDIPEIYANELCFDEDRITPVFATPEYCETGGGPCGNCKRLALAKLRREGYHIVYIGDGITDACAAREADFILATGSLAAQCVKEGLPYAPFSDFFQALKILFT